MKKFGQKASFEDKKSLLKKRVLKVKKFVQEPNYLFIFKSTKFFPETSTFVQFIFLVKKRVLKITKVWSKSKLFVH